MTEKTTEKTAHEKAETTAVPAGVPPKAKKPSRRKTPKKGKKVFIARGKRKESVARAAVSAGDGSVRFNRLGVQSIPNHYIRDLITEPLRFLGPEAQKISIRVNVYGGGQMGQAQAARTAIARGLVGYLEDETFRQKLLSADRSLLIEDSRRVEPKKYKGPKARARFQKSYR